MPSSTACGIVIFGASGDLARRKLIPALYDLSRQGLLAGSAYILGFARTPKSDGDFRAECRASAEQHARIKPFDPAAWDELAGRLFYMAADYGSAKDHARVAERCGQLDAEFGNAPGNRLFYIATPPEAFDEIIECLAQRQRTRGFERLIIEKPFGEDLASARKLNALLHRSFAEEQVFRIDHYLGKETVQNLMVLRFANSIFEPIWNYKYIDHVQITVAESLGVGTRVGYYDRSGALRDMVQNHLFQLMSLVAMEPPAALDAVSVRDEKVKVYRSIRPIRSSLIDRTVVRGQYTAGRLDGQSTEGYRREKGVAPGSRTETFVALKLYIDNWRWSGMPFYLRTGKFMPEKLSEVVVRFRSPPLTLFQKQCEAPVYPNDLVIRIQPDEGVSFRLNGKVPGGQMMIKPVAMDFSYRTTFHAEPPEAYERLIADAIAGDQTLFIRADETEAAWSVIDPIEQGFAQSQSPPEEYAPGTWGPKRALELIEADGRRWLHARDGQEEPIIACAL